MSERPVFVVGVHRSGTTLLRFMLSSHPRLYVPPESDFIPRLFGRRPTEPFSDKQIARTLSEIFENYRFVKEWQGERPTVEALMREMRGRQPADFLQALYGLYARQYRAARWVDKTPIYASYMDLLDEIFPEAHFVHIIRDGRDVALSMIEKWGRKEMHVDIYFAAQNWARRIRQAQASGARLAAGRYLEMRYEQLVAEPEAELRRLCAFLGEGFVPEMAQPQKLARQQIRPDDFHAPLRHAPSTGRVGRWRTEMGAADLRLFQRVAGKMLVELGYPEVEAGRMGPAERARMIALAAKYEVLQAGRRLLQAVGVMPPI